MIVPVAGGLVIVSVGSSEVFCSTGGRSEVVCSTDGRSEVVCSTGGCSEVAAIDYRYSYRTGYFLVNLIQNV